MTPRLISACLFFATAWLVRGVVLEEFPIWLAGALLLWIPPLPLSPDFARLARWIAPLPYLALFFCIAKSRDITGITGDYLLAIFTFLLMWILLSATGPHAHRSHAVKASRGLARFSYTLYAVHTPLVVFLGSLLVRDTRWQPTPVHLLVASGVLAATIGYAYGIAWLTEFRTDGAYLQFARLLGIRSPSPVLPSNPAAQET